MALDPRVRESPPRTRRRGVLPHGAVHRHRWGPVVQHRPVALHVGEPELQPEHVEVLVLALDGLADGRPTHVGGQCGVECRPRLLRCAGDTAGHQHLDHPECVVEALVGIRPGHRTPLGLIGVEQAGPCPATLHGGELPHQVVRVGHPGVESQTSGGREAVGGVAHQEDVSVPVALGDLARHPPRTDVLDDEVEVLHSGSRPEQRGTTLGGVLVERLRFGVPVMHEDPRGPEVVGHEDTAHLRVHRPVEGRRAFADQMTEVGGDVDHDEVLEDVGSLHRDAECPTDPATGAVGGHHVPGRDGPDLSGPHVPQGARHPVGDLLAPGPLDTLRQPVDMVAEHGLEPMLGEVAERRGRDDVEFGELVLALERDPAELVAHEGRHPSDPGTVLGRGTGGQHLVHVDTGRPKDFEGAGTDDVGRRRRQAPGAALDDDVVDALLGEEQRGDESHRTAAHHQDGRRARHPIERRFGRGCPHSRPSYAPPSSWRFCPVR